MIGAMHDWAEFFQIIGPTLRMLHAATRIFIS